jgi:hypothetical protein
LLAYLTGQLKGRVSGDGQYDDACRYGKADLAPRLSDVHLIVRTPSLRAQRHRMGT